MKYKNYIEKIAQAKWRKHIDRTKTEDELYDFVSATSRNRDQLFDRPGNYEDRRDIGFDKKKMKQRLSTDTGLNYSTRKNALRSVPLNKSTKEEVKRRREIANFSKEDRELEKAYAKRKSTVMQSPGSVGGGPDDYVDIVHGGNKARIEGFLRSGSGATDLQTKEILPNKEIANSGLQFHSKVKNRAGAYADMAKSSKGGIPTKLEAKIKRKYLFANSTQGDFSDEYGLPSQYFNKLKDIKVSNTETGEIYNEMKDNSGRLPYGKTKTPGFTQNKKSPAIDSKLYNQNFRLDGKVKDLSEKPNVADFKAKRKAGIAKRRAGMQMVPYQGFTMRDGTSSNTDFNELKNNFKKERSARRRLVPFTGFTMKDGTSSNTDFNELKNNFKRERSARRRIAPFTGFTMNDGTSSNTDFNELKNNFKKNRSARRKVAPYREPLINSKSGLKKSLGKNRIAKGLGAGLAGLGLGYGVSKYRKNKKESKE